LAWRVAQTLKHAFLGSVAHAGSRAARTIH
jgi:hypothetical protein